jgi:hypothetical protein
MGRTVFSSSYTALLLPLMAASRLKARLMPSKGTQDVNRELEVSSIVDGVLKALFDLCGISLAVGGAVVSWLQGPSDCHETGRHSPVELHSLEALFRPHRLRRRFVLYD